MIGMNMNGLNLTVLMLDIEPEVHTTGSREYFELPLTGLPQDRVDGHSYMYYYSECSNSFTVVTKHYNYSITTFYLT